jgi:hypothetical protein
VAFIPRILRVEKKHDKKRNSNSPIMFFYLKEKGLILMKFYSNNEARIHKRNGKGTNSLAN